MDRVYTIDEIKKIVAPIAQAHDVGRIYLFGSYAHGEATATQDFSLQGILKMQHRDGSLTDIRTSPMNRSRSI